MRFVQDVRFALAAAGVALGLAGAVATMLVMAVLLYERRQPIL